MKMVRGDFERTGDHWWWRAGWTPASRQVTFHLTFDGEGSLERCAERVSSAVGAAPHVDPVPPRWLHLSMTNVGFAGALPATAVAEVRDRVFPKVAAIADAGAPLVLDTLVVGGEGMWLGGPTPDWLAELKVVQERAVRDVVDPDVVFGAFWPHVSLAYWSGPADDLAILARLRASPGRAREVVVPGRERAGARVEEEAPGREAIADRPEPVPDEPTDLVLRRPTLALIELTREERLYTWRVLAEQRLDLG